MLTNIDSSNSLSNQAFRFVMIGPIRVPLSWTLLGGMIPTDSPSDSDTAENRIRHQTSEVARKRGTGRTRMSTNGNESLVGNAVLQREVEWLQCLGR
jgi:hypothetical protein